MTHRERVASERRPRRNQKRHVGWNSNHYVVAIGILALTAASPWWIRTLKPVAIGTQTGTLAESAPGDVLPTPPKLTDERLQRAADQLLALVDPERPENDYFSDFTRDRLRWMVREHGAGRLDVAFLTEASNGPLPPDVLMAAWKHDGKPTIFIAKSRFMKFLIETGTTEPPFRQQQRNDFALALVHEIVHLQNPNADPKNMQLRAAEESRVWREVSVQAVRPMRTRNQPMSQRFKDVDDALRACRDALPCPLLARLVRLSL